MKCSVCAVIAAALIASSAWSQVTPNTIGVYMPEAIQACNALGWGWWPPGPPACCPWVGCVSAPGAFQVMVMAKSTSQPCVGVEFGYDIVLPPGLESSVYLIEAVLPPGALNIGGSPLARSGEIVMGWQTPAPPSDSITLVTWTFLVVDPSFTMEFFLHGVESPSVSGGLPVLYGEANAHTQMTVSSGFVEAPVAVVNLPGSPIPEFCLCSREVATAGASFGAVKALYR